MEFLDEESRPRFLFQSRPLPHPSETQTETLHKPTLIFSLSASFFLLAFSIFYLQSEPFQSLLIWLSLSLLLGPFAPSSLTAGDIRVGLGPAIPPPLPQDQDNDQSNPIESNRRGNRKSKPRKPEESGSAIGVYSTPATVNGSGKSERKEGNNGSTKIVEEEKEWSEGDIELLKKLIVKHPVGKPGRWEAISGAFGGRRGVESVIKMAKAMGEKKMSDGDSFARFLKDRKPVDKRIENLGEVIDGEVEKNGEMRRENEGTGSGSSWSSGEDISLLNALKAFPKDVPMRWEKIAAAVPGKPKAACVKRVAELKRDFRSSKGSSET